ncbi:MAG TPA: IS1380 family transposase [Acidimicrobiales bacterium]
MQVCHSLDRLDVIFDDEHLVANAGLMLPATLAQHLGLRELLDTHVDLGDAAGRANVGHKAMTLVHSALAGGDSIDDADALRSGESQAALGHVVLAPSTLGTFLRSFSWGHARQLDTVSGQLLARAWSVGAGPGDEALTIDVDSSIHETYGLAKEGGTKFSYNHVRGYHPLYAVAAQTGDVVHTRLRGGNAHAGRGAAGFLTETFNRVRAAGATGPIVLRADSGFYNHKVVQACAKADVRHSITVKLYKGKITEAIAAIDESAWTPIPYFLDGAAVAETIYRPFGAKGTECRLIVRRVRPTPGSQLALFTEFSYHAFITDREGDTLELEADHRRHADIENVIRDLKYGVGLNHLPSGRFGANAAWLALNVMAHNLARWSTRLGLGEGIVTTETLRRRYFSAPGRITRSARRFTVHMPARWPWADRYVAALERYRDIVLVT